MKVRPLPVIDQDRPSLVFPLSAADMFSDHLMEDAADTAESFSISHHDLRRDKTLSALQLPLKILRVDSTYQSGLIHLILLHLHQKLPAVYKGESVTVSLFLCGTPVTDHDERIMLVTGSPSHTAHRLHSVHNPASFQIPLHRVPSVKRKPFIVPRLPVHGKTCRLLQHDCSLSFIDDLNCPCNDVLLFKHTKIQADFKSCLTVSQSNCQCLCLFLRSVRRRKPRKTIFSFPDLTAFIEQTGCSAAVGILYLQCADPIIPCPETAVFLRKYIQRICPVNPSHFIRIPRKTPVPVTDHIGFVRIIRLFPIISMQQYPLPVDFHLIGCIFCLKSDRFYLIVKYDTH